MGENMLVWLGVFLIFGINSFFNSEKNKVWNLLFFLSFIFIYSMRNNVGSDWKAYLFYFDNILINPSAVKDYNFEFLYKYLNIYGSMIFPSFRWLVFFISIFNGLLFWQSTKKYTKTIGLVMILSLYFIFFSTIEALRQSITLFLFYFSLQYINKRPLKYLLINTVGICFHSAGIFTVLFLIFNRYKFLQRIMIIFMCFFTNLERIFSKIIENFPMMYSKYSWYMNFSKMEQSIISFKLIEYIILVCIYLFFLKKEGLDDWNKTNLNLLIFGLLMQVSVGRYTNIMYRMIYFTDIGFIFAIVYIYNRIRSFALSNIYIMIVILYILFRFYRSFPYNDPKFFYKFI